MEDYISFLESKHLRSVPSGFDIEDGFLDRPDAKNHLFDWQKVVTKWALKLGKAALFEDCGLGKTAQQLFWADAVRKETGKPVLILTPLAVAPQTENEAELFGIENVTVPTVDGWNNLPALNAVNDNYTLLANYEKLHLVEPYLRQGFFGGIVLDESSILKSYMGKIKRAIIDACKGIPYKLACTATPAPNDHIELGNHAEFLDVMPSNEMLSRWFINDSAECGNYRLKGHAVKDFWAWVASWAVCISKPSDIGFDDTGYILPKLNIKTHIISSENCPPPEGQLFHVGGVSATNIHKVGRSTVSERAKITASLVNNYDCLQEPVIVWCNTNYEADALHESIHEHDISIFEIRGNDKTDAKESRIIEFSSGKITRLLTKPTIAGYGVNWQHCSKQIFMGLSFSYEDFYQAIRRSWRYGQTRPVDIHIVTTDAEMSVLQTIEHKKEAHEKMKAEMVQAMKENQMENINGVRNLVDVPAPKLFEENDWQLWRGDCVDAVKNITSDTIGISIFSPPFSNLYIYSDSIADMGNCKDMDEFFAHFKFLIPELLRITMPGRLCVVHCKDLPSYRGRDGQAGLIDFPGIIRYEFEKAGWKFHSRVTIWKCPVTEMTRTKSQGLLYKQLRKDSTFSRQGMSDYLMVFRKGWGDGNNPNPVTHTHDEFPLKEWQNLASPVWSDDDFEEAPGFRMDLTGWPTNQVWADIKQTNVLNGSVARNDRDEKHICPLQKDTIARSLKLWSNQGDIVFSPFAGIGSEGFVSILGNRKFIGVELKDEYCKLAIKHLREATILHDQKQLIKGVI